MSNTEISISDKDNVLQQKLIVLGSLSFSLLNYNSGTTVPTFLVGSANDTSGRSCRMILSYLLTL